jgi:hypothetical protein
VPHRTVARGNARNLLDQLRTRRFWLHVFLAGFLALGSQVVYQRIVFALWPPPYFGVLAQVGAVEAMFREAGPFLPPGGQVGYLQEEYSRSRADDYATFFIAQYALVPRVLVEGTRADVVLAVPRPDQGAPDVPDGFSVERRLASGLAIFRRDKR